MEIVTWVLDGELEHKDTLGNSGVIYPGLAQRMSAGRGIWHSEKNLDRVRDVHFVQMWVLPDREGADPSYEQLDINPQLDRGGLVPIASGRGHDSAIRIHQRGASLWGGRLTPGETVRIPDARYAHLYVARGVVNLADAGDLGRGDSARIEEVGPLAVVAGAEGAEVLVWESD
jgi:redox-sensitive bicupin YhaK (pirin superfamily)